MVLEIQVLDWYRHKHVVGFRSISNRDYITLQNVLSSVYTIVHVLNYHVFFYLFDPCCKNYVLGILMTVFILDTSIVYHILLIVPRLGCIYRNILRTFSLQNNTGSISMLLPLNQVF